MKPPTKAKQSTLKPLTVRQLQFCELIVEGRDGTAAYLGAGWKGSREAAKVSASRLLTFDNVKARIAELRKPQTAESLLTKDAKRRFYFEVVNDPAAKMADRLRASELDAKMAGHFEPDRLAVDSGPNLLESIRERASAVASALDRNGRQRQQEAAPAAVPGQTAGPASGNGHVGALSRWVPPAPD